MANIEIRVDGKVGVGQVRANALELPIVADDDRLYLRGNCGAFRAFAEAILMAVPPPKVVTERSILDGTEVVLDAEVGR